MVAPDRPPAWARHELDALARLRAVQVVAEAIVTGQWSADPAVVDQVALIAESAAERLRWRDACGAA